MKDCFYPLRSAEKVGMAYHGVQRLAAVADHTVEFKCDVTFTDAAFWNIFNFRFLSGKPYGEEEVQSGIMDAVVSESVARRLYGTTEVVGRTVEISYVPYTIRAVVRDVSLLAESAYGDVWLPYTTDNSLYDDSSDRLIGGFRCYILASSSADFGAIHSEAEANIARLNESQSTHLLRIGGAPDTHLGDLAREDAFSEPNVQELVMKYLIIVLVLLLIPAINMSGITQSRMRKRMAEIGVRKAFGATRSELLTQVLYENLLQTLLGGVLGLFFSYASVLLLSDWLLDTGTASMGIGRTFVNAEMMFNPVIFLYAFLACLALNLLSAGIPAWRASRMRIISALNENVH